MARRRKKFQLENIKIDKYAAEGKSIAQWEEKVLFVQGAIPGDIVDCYVIKNKSNWAEAKLRNVSTPSPLRQEAFCTHFGLCGGCKWQMLAYEQQLIFKELQVKEQIAHLGKFDVQNFLPIIACKSDRMYRNKMEFTFSCKQYLSKEDLDAGLPFDKNVLGFHAPGVFDKIIDIETCYLQEDPTNAIKNFVRSYAYEHNLSFQNIREHTGLLRNLIIRLNTKGNVMVNIVFGEPDMDNINRLCAAVQEKFPEITSMHYTINEKLNDSIYDIAVHHFSGEAYITETLGTRHFKISPKSFFQTNPKQAEVLYNVVKDFTGQQNILYDLYCGTGSIGLYLADVCTKIIGVETVADAIEDAKINAHENSIDHAHFFSGDVIKICTSDFFEKHGVPDCIIVDPPRAGMHTKLVDKLIEIKAPRIVYVSCNPATQARDVALLSEHYDVSKSQAVDMFPQTHHIENVMQLNLKG